MVEERTQRLNTDLAMWEDSLEVKLTLRNTRLATVSRINVTRFSLATGESCGFDSSFVQRSKPLSFVARDPDIRIEAPICDATLNGSGRCQPVRGKILPATRPRKTRPRLKDTIIAPKFFVTRDIKGSVALIGAISRVAYLEKKIFIET
jgi:hypothetical protein